MRKLIKIILAIFALIIILGLIISLTKDKEIKEPKEPPEAIPEGFLVNEIPQGADVLFVSMRYVMQDPACLDNKYRLKKSFLNDMVCNKLIYNQEANVLAAPRQLYTLDIETEQVIQLTNIDCDFSSSKPIDSERIMAIGACSDTDDDGILSTKDEINIYIVDLKEETTECLTCDLDITAMNNPDYSQVNEKIIFSAQRKNKFHNYLFTLDLDKNLEQITDNEEVMDFDCSWSEDGEKIIFNRLPLPFLEKPSVVWIMDADGTNKEQLTYGGDNPNNEGPHGPYPIGLDADPDLSPDNKLVAFSRLKSGKENGPFGVFDLILVDVETKELTTLDSNFANMVPEWKEGGILFIKQWTVGDQVMDRRQSMHLYKDGEFINLEPDHSIFPIGSNGASWIE